MSDPFADDPFSDKAPESGEPTRAPDPARIGVTLKRGSGFDDPWITVRGADTEEVLAHLGDVLTAELPRKVALAADNFYATAAGVSGGAPAARKGGGKPTRPDDGPPPGAGQEFCDHGPMTYKSGKKNGKPWSGFFCPEDDCKVIWL